MPEDILVVHGWLRRRVEEAAHPHRAQSVNEGAHVHGAYAAIAIILHGGDMTDERRGAAAVYA